MSQVVRRLFIPLLDNNEEDSKVSLHFGHAPYFGVYDFGDKKFEVIKNSLDHGNLKESPVDQIIENINPTVVFAQDMGMRAINLFTKNNIELKSGSYKTAKGILDNFNSLKDLSNSCGH